jgi:hypothetical protein
VHQAPVVPDDEISRPPLMTVSQLRTNCHFVDVLNQLAALIVVETLYELGVVAEKDAFAPRIRMGADDRMVDWRDLASLGFSHGIFTMAPAAGKIQIVHGAHPLELLLHILVKSIVCAIHVAEMRFPARARHLHRVQKCRLTRNPPPGAIRVPGERTLVRMLTARRAVLVEIRKEVELRKPIRVILIHDVNLHLAEIPSELHLARRRKILVSEQQKLMILKSRVDLREQLLVAHSGKVHTDNFDTESRTERTCVETLFHQWILLALIVPAA